MIEIKKENYYHGLWRACLPNADFFAVMWKAADDGKWHLKYRFRYFTSDKVWESDDRRSWYVIKADDGPEVEETLHNGFEAMLNIGGELGKFTDIHFIPCKGDGDAMAAILANPERPGIFTKAMTPEQVEEYQRTNKLPKGV